MITRIGLVVFFASVIPAVVSAQISPGDLAQPHAHLEGMTNCTKCHTLGGGPDTKKCLECHVEIKDAIQKERGYHFQVITQESKTCFGCHSDHNGRDFDLIFWPDGKDAFDHSKTGYTLQGKHLEVRCATCHQPENMAHDLRKLNAKVDVQKTFLGLDSACLSCHKDEHQGQLSNDCLKCHTYSAWKPAVKFSHNDARFQLIGRHQSVECSKCHVAVAVPGTRTETGKAFFAKFVGLGFSNCTSCHQDVHRGKFGPNCQKCHDSFGWNRINSDAFDHARTRYPLVGLHRQVACQKCHMGGKIRAPLKFANCTDCHRDAHLGQFADRGDGGRCESCHDVSGFIPARYDLAEHQKSRYPLTGAHLAVPCVACHELADRGTSKQRRVFDFSDLSCKGCHPDVHKGQFAAQVQQGGCETCHQTPAWRSVNFNHTETRFPLVGKHQTVACGKCHKTVDKGTSRERTLYRPMATACKDCHQDVHGGQFERAVRPRSCENCHTPKAWRALIFDHDRDSLFPLRGAHEKVQCAACHKKSRHGTAEFVLFRPIDKRCVHCHGS